MPSYSPGPTRSRSPLTIKSAPAFFNQAFVSVNRNGGGHGTAGVFNDDLLSPVMYVPLEVCEFVSSLPEADAPPHGKHHSRMIIKF